MTDYQQEYGTPIAITQKRSKGRPKKEGELKSWDIRLTPTDQVEVSFDALETDDFKVLLICKEGEPNGLPRLHYHMYMETTRSDNYIDNLLNRLGKATADKKGNAVFSKRKSHEGTIGYIVKNKDVVFRLGVDNHVLEEYFQKSDDYVRNKANERKTESRAKLNFIAELMKDPVVKRLTDPEDITTWILKKYVEHETRFPNRSTIESAVMTLLWAHRQHDVVEWYSPKFFRNE